MARAPLSSMTNGTFLYAGTDTPVVGLSAYVYQHGTTTEVTVYAAETGGTLANPLGDSYGQPVSSNSNGQLPGWVTSAVDLDIVPSGNPAEFALPIRASDLGGASGNPTSFAQSQTIYVNGTYGNDSNSGLSWVAAKATFNAAVSALGGVGGTIQISGTVNATAVSGGLALPAGTTVSGVARGSSVLQCLVDGGTGYGIANCSASTPTLPIKWQNININGPGQGAFTIGSKPANMFGINSGPKMGFTNVNISGFAYGVQLAYDHESFTNCGANSNYYNIYVTGSGGTNGNQAFFNCDLTGATRASIGIGGGGVLNTVNFVNTHVGFAPVGVYKETATTQQGALVNCNGSLWFESCANACVFENGPTSSSTTIENCHFNNPYFVNYGPSLSTYYDSTISYVAPVNVGTIANLYIENDQGGAGAGTTMYKVLNQSWVQTDKAPAASDFGTYNFIGSRYVGAGGIYGNGAGFAATVYQVVTSAAVAGEVAQMQGNLGACPFGLGNTNAYVGVFYHAAPVSSMVAVVTQGNCQIMCSDHLIYSGLLLECDPTVNAQVRCCNIYLGSGNGAPTTRAPSPYPMIATTTGTNTGTNTLIPAMLYPGSTGMAPGFISPLVVSALPTAGSAYVGMMLIVLGNHTSTYDTLYTCLESASATYSWVTVAHG